MSDNSTVKVQINSFDALQRFIGDNPEFKMQIKETIINQFAKQFLKTGENDILNTVKQLIDTELKETDYCGVFRKIRNSYNQMVLSDKMKELIKNEMQNQVREFMNAEVIHMIENQFGPVLQYAKELANAKCDEIVHIISQENINNLVKQRLTSLLNSDEFKNYG